MPFVLGVRFENNTPFDFHGGRGAASARVRGWLNEIQKRVLFAIGEKWFSEVFPLHFSAGNKSRYRFEPRNRSYLLGEKNEQGVGKGKNPNIFVVFSGESERAMTALPPRISGNHKKVTVRVSNPPFYFGNPFIGRREIEKEVRGKDGSTRTIAVEFNVRRQPDKVAEVTQIPNRDEAMLRRFGFAAMQPAIRSVNRKIKKQVKTFR